MDRLSVDEYDNLEDWARTLLLDHGCEADNLQDRSGWNNRVWLSDTHVLRLSSGRFRGSFRHELDMFNLARGKVPVPEIVEHGATGDREWLISRRVAEHNLLYCWPQMSEESRKDAMAQLGSALEALHNLQVPDGFANPWIKRAIDEQVATDFYLIEPAEYGLLLEGLENDELVDLKMLQAARKYIEDRQSLFESKKNCIIHGDIHFGNLAWDGETLSIIDWELATLAAPDRELQMLLDFVDTPGSVGADDPRYRAEDFGQVITWIAMRYPALFVEPDLIEKLNIYGVMRALHQSRYSARGHPGDPRVRIQSVLDGASLYQLENIL